MKSIIKWIFFAAIFITITVICFNFAKEEKFKTEQDDIKTEMLQVQGKAKITYENYHVNNENALKGQKMEDTTYEQLYGISEISNYYKWDLDTLKEVGITDPILEEGEFYLINYDEEEVVYSKGYNAEDGNTYYKLSDIKNIGKVEETENQEVEEEVPNDGEGENKAE